jgi:transcription elongation factor Elf1
MLVEPDKCTVCGHEVVAITLMVDGNEMAMNSCENCDTRSWNLGGAPIDLKLVLEQVGTHSGRRR